MNTTLSALDARVLGSLIEKQLTTPDQYPLSINALVNACNQKSNRDPLTSLDERTVQDTVDGLKKRHLILEKSGFGSRVPKYHQIFCNTEFGTLKLQPIETGILCELLLRGPQTPGELRARVARMAPVTDVNEIEHALEAMRTRAAGPLVVQLPREPNRRDARYAQLFTDTPIVESASEATEPEPVASSMASRSETIASLSARVEALEHEVANCVPSWKDFRKNGEDKIAPVVTQERPWIGRACGVPSSERAAHLPPGEAARLQGEQERRAPGFRRPQHARSWVTTDATSIRCCRMFFGAQPNCIVRFGAHSTARQ